MVRKTSDEARALEYRARVALKEAEAKKAKAKSESSSRTTRGGAKSAKSAKARDLEDLQGTLAKVIENGKKINANGVRLKKLKEDASKNSKILAGVTPSHSEHGAVPENYGGRIARLEYCFFVICAYWVLGFFYSKILETYSA